MTKLYGVNEAPTLKELEQEAKEGKKSKEKKPKVKAKEGKK